MRRDRRRSAKWEIEQGRNPEQNADGMPLCSPRMLALAVRDLEAYGLISCTIFLEIPPRVQYALTPKGYSPEPLLISLRDWGRAAYAP